jgi:hypothetical protein
MSTIIAATFSTDSRPAQSPTLRTLSTYPWVSLWLVSLWCTLAWYILLVFLVSSIHCSCPIHIRSWSLIKVPMAEPFGTNDNHRADPSGRVV